MYDVIVYSRGVLWGDIKKHMVRVSSQICLRASLVKSGCFTNLETLHFPVLFSVGPWIHQEMSILLLKRRYYYVHFQTVL